MSEGESRPDADADLAARWAAGYCPMIDGVVFGDGRVKRVLTDWVEHTDDHLEFVIEPGEWTTLEELQRRGELDWVETGELCTTEDAAGAVVARGGETSYGSEGFVAALRADGGAILWVAIFSNSNPYKEVRVEGDCVLAQSTHDTWWRFPLDAPERVRIL